MGRTLAVGALAISLLAACGQSPKTSHHATSQPTPPAASSAGAPPASTPAPPPGVSRCHTAQLEVAFTGTEAATGNVEDDFEVRNKSAAACWVYGYPGFRLLDATGNPLPGQTLKRETDSFFGTSNPPTTIVLPPATAPLGSGQSAGHAFFNIATDDVMCNGSYWQSIASLEIWPPDEFASLRISAHRADGSQFISCGQMGINPVQVRPHPNTG